jgi:hypothetical protein
VEREGVEEVLTVVDRGRNLGRSRCQEMLPLPSPGSLCPLSQELLICPQLQVPQPVPHSLHVSQYVCLTDAPPALGSVSPLQPPAGKCLPSPGSLSSANSVVCLGSEPKATVRSRT